MKKMRDTGTQMHLESKNLGIGRTLTNEYYAQRAREAEDRRKPKLVKQDGRELRSKFTDDQIAHCRWLYENGGVPVDWIANAFQFASKDECRRIVVDYYTRARVGPRFVPWLNSPKEALDKV